MITQTTQAATPLRAPRADIDQFVRTIKDAAYAFDGRLTLAEVIGAIEVAKHEILKDST